MRTALVVMLLAAGANASADSNAAARQSSSAQNAAAAAAVEQQTQEDGQRVGQLIGLDPTRIRSVGLWPGKDVPCKLPKRDSPYVCHRLLEGPAIILSRLLPIELIVARGDQALASGSRSWWLHTGAGAPVPMALAPGEVLYEVGDMPGYLGDGDLVVTVYR